MVYRKISGLDRTIDVSAGALALCGGKVTVTINHDTDGLGKRMEQKQYHFPVQIYYEDTGHSGVVYHANYLKYFERAREHVIGSDVLARLWEEEGIGFAVYKADMGFFEGAQFGDLLDVRTRFKKDGEYKIVWHQEAWRPGGSKAAVTAVIELVCLDRNKRLRPIPALGDLAL